MAQGYKDFTAGAVLAAADLEDYCELQSVMRFASAAARNSALSGVLTEGLLAYLIDSNTLTIYSGSAWSTVGPVHGALSSWTPTLTQSGAVTVTVNYAKYQRIGRTVRGWFKLTVSGSGSSNNPILIGNLPATADTSDIIIGSGQIYDVSITTASLCVVSLGSTTTFDLRGGAGQADNRLGITGNLFGGALASGDIIKGEFSYEAAADA